MLQNSIHVWITDIDRVDDPYLKDVYRSILSADELERLERLKFEKDQNSFLVSHAMVRSVLSNYVEIAPKDLQFKTSANGKPTVFCEEGKSLPLEYNMSHSGKYAVMVATNEIVCGIDVEKINAERNFLDIAADYFSSKEVIDLKSVLESDQAHRFYTYWTLKEAYIKAKGETIGSSINKVSFDVHHPEQIRVQLNEAHGFGVGENCEGWQFHSQLLDSEYVMSLALQHENPFDFKIELFETIPMQVFG